MPTNPRTVSTSVFRGVSDADCLRQAEVESRNVLGLGYAPISETWMDDGGMRVLTVVYGYGGKPAAEAAQASGARADPWTRMKTPLGVAGAVLFAAAGFAMLTIKSQSATPTVAELFDNYVGIFSLGMAALTLLIALAARRE